MSVSVKYRSIKDLKTSVHMAEQGQCLLKNDISQIKHILILLVIIYCDWFLLKGGAQNLKVAFYKHWANIFLLTIYWFQFNKKTKNASSKQFTKIYRYIASFLFSNFKIDISESTAWKVSVFGVIQSKSGKMRIRITPNTDTSYAVVIYHHIRYS